MVTMAFFAAMPAWGVRNLYDATRMAWQWRERQFVCRGAYARAKMLHDGSLVLAYGTARKVYLKNTTRCRKPGARNSSWPRTRRKNMTIPMPN